MKLEIGHIKDKNKGKDALLWANFIGKKTKKKFDLIYMNMNMKGYFIEPTEMYPNGWGGTRVKVRKKDYSRTRSKHFKNIIEDDERLEHWTKLIQELKKNDADLLQFIVEKKVPLEKFIEKAFLENKKF